MNTRRFYLNISRKTLKHFFVIPLFIPIHIGGYLREKYLFKHPEVLPVTQFHKVLDAGCSPGIFTRKLGVAYPDKEVAGLDAEEFT